MSVVAEGYSHFSPMRDVGELVHGEGDFILLKVYMDESGIHQGSAICIVAGFIAPLARCIALEQEWKELLRRRSVDCFHAKEFTRSSGQFRGWDSQRRMRFSGDAVGVINAALDSEGCVVVGAAILTETFFSMGIEERRWLTGGVKKENGKWRESGAPTKPYFLPFQQCVVDAVRSAPPGKGLVHFVFDEQNQYQASGKKLISTMRNQHCDLNDRIGDVVYSSKLRALPLQVADFLAYQSFQYFTDGDKRLSRDKRLTSSPYLAQRNALLTFIDAQSLSKMLVQNPITHAARFTWPSRTLPKKGIPMGTKVVRFPNSSGA